MKKLLFISLSMFLLVCCGKKSENQTENESENNVEVNVDSLRADSISKVEAVAFDNPEALPYVDFGESGKLYLTKDGNLSYNDLNMENGKYVKDNGAYLLFWSMGDVPSKLAVVVGDKYYEVYDNNENPDENFTFLMDYFMSNFFTEDNPFKEMVIYNPSDNSVSYKKQDGMGKVMLSEIPSQKLKTVYWKNC